MYQRNLMQYFGRKFQLIAQGPKTVAPNLEVVYAALGREHVVEAAISAWSLKLQMPNVTVSLTTDQMVECPYFDTVKTIRSRDRNVSPSKFAKLHKMIAINSSSADNIVYLDSDTYITSDIRDVSSSIYDIAACHDTWQFSQIYRQFNNGLPSVDAPAHHAFLNGGVLFVKRTPSALRLIDQWGKIYGGNDKIDRDQLVLQELAYDPELRLLVLPNTFNVRAAEHIHISGPIRILHMYSNRLSKNWSDTSAFRADFLNKTERNRVFTSHDGRLVWIDEDFITREDHLNNHKCRTEREEYLHPKVDFIG